jgi:hypothetical protein
MYPMGDDAGGASALGMNYGTFYPKAFESPACWQALMKAFIGVIYLHTFIHACTTFIHTCVHNAGKVCRALLKAYIGDDARVYQ